MDAVGGCERGDEEFDLDDLLQVERDGRGLVTVLELSDVQDKPALFSTFMMWMLARLYATLPEVGDVDRPKLMFFFDEAHLLFDDAPVFGGAERAKGSQTPQPFALGHAGPC